MLPITYHANISVGSRLALERLSWGEWSGILVAGAAPTDAVTSFRVDAVRVLAEPTVLIRALPLDIVPKLESFVLRADLVDRDRETTGMFENIERWITPFWQTKHQLFIGTRRLATPDWQEDGIRDLVSEDILLIRGPASKQLFIIADEEQPGSLLVSSEWDSLPSAGRELESFSTL